MLTEFIELYVLNASCFVLSSENFLKFKSIKFIKILRKENFEWNYHYH